jgi:hypothetical protein
MKRGNLIRYAANLSLVAALAAIFGTDGPALGGSSTPPARGFGTTAPNPVQPIVKEMKDAQSRLKGGDTGPGTRGVQEHVVRDLDKLIEAAARQSDSSRGSRQPQSEAKSPQESQNGSPEEGKAQQNGSLGPPSNTAGSEPGRTNGKRQSNHGDRSPRPQFTRARGLGAFAAGRARECASRLQRDRAARVRRTGAALL